MKKHTKNILLNITEGIITFIIVILAFFILINLTLNIVYIKTHVKNYSMQPTLNSSITHRDQEGDLIYVNKFSSYKVGDIVVAEVSWWKDGPIIKRLVGCPGDKIQIKEEDGKYNLFVNNNLLYSRAKTSSSTIGHGTEYQYQLYLNFLNNQTVNSRDVSSNIGLLNGEKCIQLKQGEYFLMGDNWEASDDCLMYGPASLDDLIGKVDYVVPLGENTFIAFWKYFYNVIFTKNNNFKY